MIPHSPETETKEWQPARLRRVHSREPIKGKTVPAPKLLKFVTVSQIVRVCEAVNPDLALFRAMGCDATKFYFIHPEDSGVSNAAACEHEVLSD